MTFTQTAKAMRRLADVLDQAISQAGDVDNGKPAALMQDECAVGAAAMLCYIRDLLTTGPRETYDRATLLVILEVISRDAKIFPCGIGKLIWNAENDESDLTPT